MSTASNSPYRSDSPAEVATALAADHCVHTFPCYGMRYSREGELECECMAGKRTRHVRDGDPMTECRHLVGKQPRIGAWPDRASCSPGQLRAWCRKFPFANYSALTGSDSGLWLLDVDGEAGFRSLAELEVDYGPLPPTWRTVSGSGTGGHFWFALPAGIIVRNSASQVAPAVDVRGEHGQAVLPGSWHKSGNRYRWLDGCAPDEVALAIAPEPWIEAVLDACKKTRRRDPDAPAAESVARSRRQVARPRRAHSASLVIGDGEGRGGFHDPINRIAIDFFFRAGSDHAAAPLKDALRTAILAAPADNHEAWEIERYASDDYLDAQIESAMSFVRGRAV